MPRLRRAYGQQAPRAGLRRRYEALPCGAAGQEAAALASALATRCDMAVGLGTATGDDR